MNVQDSLFRQDPAGSGWPSTSLVSARTLLAELPPRRLLRPAAPLADQLRLTITAHRPRYVVGEPLRLQLSLRNTGADPARGYFVLDPGSGELEIWFRLNGAAWRRLGRPVLWGCFLHPTKTLAPGAELCEEVVLAFDHARQLPLFFEPGCCDIRALYQDVVLDENAALASNTVTVHVGRPHDRAGWTALTRELALLTESDGRYVTSRTTKAAARFLDQFPEAPYAPYLREGLERALYDRVVRGQATPQEESLFERLQAERTAQAQR